MRNISIKKWELTISKFKSSRLSSILDEALPFVIDKSKSKTGLHYQQNLLYLTEVWWAIADLAYVQNKDNQY